MAFSNVSPCPDNRPVVELSAGFRFGNERHEWSDALEEADLPGWGESYQGHGKYGYQGR